MIRSECFTITAGTFASANLKAHIELDKWLCKGYTNKILSHTIIIDKSLMEYTISISIIYEKN